MKRLKSSLYIAATFLFVAVTMTANVKPVEAVSNGKIVYTVRTEEGGTIASNIYSMNSDGSEKTQLTDDGKSTNPSISPDGSQIAFTTIDDSEEDSEVGSGKISTIDIDGTNRQDTDQSITFYGSFIGAKWSKTGSKIAGLFLAEGGQVTLFDINPDGSGYRQHTDSSYLYSPYIDYSSDDSKVVYYEVTESGGIRAFIDNADGSNKLQLNSGDAAAASMPLFSKDNSRVYFQGAPDLENEEDASLFSVDLDGSAQTELYQLTSFGLHFALSPDGTNLAYPSLANQEIAVFATDGASQSTIPSPNNFRFDDGIFSATAFSPNSSELVFHATENGGNTNTDIFTVSADGSGMTNLTNTSDQFEFISSNNQSWWGQSADNSDSDSDGTPDSTENAAPNNGDANNDGIKDAQQSNVTSLIDPVSGNYAALAVSDACTITSLSIAAESANATADTSYDYPNGMMDFNLSCGTPGFTADISQYYYNQDSNNLILRKYNPATKAYATIDSASITNESIAGSTVAKAVYQVKDGSSLDLDNTIDGNITDPSGLGQSSDLAATGQSAVNLFILTSAITGVAGAAFAGSIATRRRGYKLSR